ncbi:MAG: hypothetical protein JWN04_2714 [Myxococcaceae bacterium]|nr:hypothetical protein [Myxococcaceae bacterium]
MSADENARAVYNIVPLPAAAAPRDGQYVLSDEAWGRAWLIFVAGTPTEYHFVRRNADEATHNMEGTTDLVLERVARTPELDRVLLLEPDPE